LLPAMCRIGRLLISWIIVLLNSNVSGKYLIDNELNQCELKQALQVGVGGH